MMPGSLRFKIYPIFNEFGSEMIISQLVGIIKYCDQNGDRMSKNNKRDHICNIKALTMFLPKV